MTRTIQLHPLSLLVGVGFALLGVGAMAQMPATKRPAAAHDSGLLQVAHPRDWVVVEEGVPFTAPVGKILVVTALGSNSYNRAVVQLKVNGIFEACVRLSQNGSGTAGYPSSSNVVPVPVGQAPRAGAVLEAIGGELGPNDARAWGYLVDA
jgi:hypothetical protein